MARQSAMERFYETVTRICGWVAFVGMPVSGIGSIWTYDWRIVATVFVLFLALVGIAIGARLLVLDEKSAAND